LNRSVAAKVAAAPSVTWGCRRQTLRCTATFGGSPEVCQAEEAVLPSLRRLLARPPFVRGKTRLEESGRSGATRGALHNAICGPRSGATRGGATQRHLRPAKWRNSEGATQRHLRPAKWRNSEGATQRHLRPAKRRNSGGATQHFQLRSVARAPAAQVGRSRRTGACNNSRRWNQKCKRRLGNYRSAEFRARLGGRFGTGGRVPHSCRMRHALIDSRLMSATRIGAPGTNLSWFRATFINRPPSPAHRWEFRTRSTRC
jgi:hypothetical protein